MCGFHIESLVERRMDHSLLDCLTVSLHSTNGRQLPAVSAVQGTVKGHWKTVGIPTSKQCNATYSESTAATGNPQSIFRPDNYTSGKSNQCVGHHISYGIASPTTTTLRLFNSLHTSARINTGARTQGKRIVRDTTPNPGQPITHTDIRCTCHERKQSLETGYSAAITRQQTVHWCDSRPLPMTCYWKTLLLTYWLF